MNPGGVAAIDDLDGLLHALDEADAAVRALYRQLAENPDLAGENESKLKELHAKRLDLAQRVGLATLARRRASAHVGEAPSTPTPAVVESISNGDDSNGAIVEPEPEPELASDESPPSAPARGAQLAQWKSTVRTEGLGVGLRTASSGLFRVSGGSGLARTAKGQTAAG